MSSEQSMKHCRSARALQHKSGAPGAQVEALDESVVAAGEHAVAARREHHTAHSARVLPVHTQSQFAGRRVPQVERAVEIRAARDQRAVAREAARCDNALLRRCAPLRANITITLHNVTHSLLLSESS